MRLLAAYKVTSVSSVILAFAKAVSDSCVGSSVGTVFCASTGTKPPLGREEAVAGNPPGAAAAAA